MSWKRLEDIFATRLEDFFKTSWRRLEDVLKTLLQDVMKTSWKRLEDVLARRLENVLKTSSEDVRLRRTYSSWSRRLLKAKTKDLFKTSSRRLHQDECLLGCFHQIIKLVWWKTLNQNFELPHQKKNIRK